MNLKLLETTRALILLLSLVYVGFGCRSDSEKHSETTSATDSNDLYLQKVTVQFAEGFAIQYHPHFKTVQIFNRFETGTDTTKYLLLERGTPKPSGYLNHQIIEIPVKRLALTSSMHIGLLDYLEAENVLVGLSSLQYVYSPKVISMIDSAKVAEIGKDQGINEEKLITLHPDLIMTTGSSISKADQYRTLAEAGIPVLNNSEWIEKSPLARAEWVKLMAALLNKEEFVNKKFAETVASYEKLTQLTLTAASKPTTLSGLNTKDIWYVPSGDSYMARFIKDAGGVYPWDSTKNVGSVPLSFESVYPIALKADYWINVGFDAKDTRASISGMDKRYSDFKSFKNGKVFGYTARVNTRGSNDYFESGNMKPDVILADLVHIFHPNLLPDHQLVYYRQLK